ncbi:MAG: Spy/CpxP family protein refolding chaperone [Candidatus Omnitrophota bacterium]
MGKKILVLVMVLGLCLSAQAVYAEQGKGMGHEKSLDEKIVCKAGMILTNKEDLGLSEEQAAKVKEIKVAVKKEVIRKDAEIEILKIDIMADMYADTINVEVVNALVDKKYDLKKAKAKYLVKAYADVGNVLTAEQKKSLKELCKKGKCDMAKGGKGGSDMMKGMRK